MALAKARRRAAALEPARVHLLNPFRSFRARMANVKATMRKAARAAPSAGALRAANTTPPQAHSDAWLRWSWMQQRVGCARHFTWDPWGDPAPYLESAAGSSLVQGSVRIIFRGFRARIFIALSDPSLLGQCGGIKVVKSPSTRVRSHSSTRAARMRASSPWFPMKTWAQSRAESRSARTVPGSVMLSGKPARYPPRAASMALPNAFRMLRRPRSAPPAPPSTMDRKTNIPPSEVTSPRQAASSARLSSGCCRLKASRRGGRSAWIFARLTRSDAASPALNAAEAWAPSPIDRYRAARNREATVASRAHAFKAALRTVRGLVGI